MGFLLAAFLSAAPIENLIIQARVACASAWPLVRIADVTEQYGADDGNDQLMGAIGRGECVMAMTPFSVKMVRPVRETGINAHVWLGSIAKNDVYLLIADDYKMPGIDL